jgi:hypothetical protein
VVCGEVILRPIDSYFRVQMPHDQDAATLEYLVRRASLQGILKLTSLSRTGKSLSNRVPRFIVEITYLDTARGGTAPISRAVQLK